MHFKAHGFCGASISNFDYELNSHGVCMFTSLRFCSRMGVFLGAVVLFGHSGTAQTAHCFNSLSGPEVPCTPRSSGGGGGVAPAPSGPSPAEIARRQRHAHALELDTRAHKAFDRGDKAEAARLFEEAAQLAPSASNIQGNRWYTRGMLAASQKNYETAIIYYKEALRYFGNNKELQENLKVAEEKAAVERGDWERAAKLLAKGAALKRYYQARQALVQEDWDRAVTDLTEFQKFISSAVTAGQKAIHEEEDALRTIKSLRPRDAPMFQRSLDHDRANVAEWNRLSRETDKYLAAAREGRTTKAEARKLDAQRQEQASNPNYPNPPPVYRDASTPRSYPDLNSYTPAQHAAHNDNDTGNTWAQKGDWEQALLSYQKALTEDPDGPFAKVIKENLDIAMKHVGPQKANAAPAGGPTAPPASPPVKAEEKPKEIVQANCTGWMTQANGSSFRLCTDERAQRYCEQSAQADGKGVISRVSCQ